MSAGRINSCQKEARAIKKIDVLSGQASSLGHLLQHLAADKQQQQQQRRFRPVGGIQMQFIAFATTDGKLITTTTATIIPKRLEFRLAGL